MLELALHFTPDRVGLFKIISDWQKERAVVEEHLGDVFASVAEEAEDEETYVNSSAEAAE